MMFDRRQRLAVQLIDVSTKSNYKILAYVEDVLVAMSNKSSEEILPLEN